VVEVGMLKLVHQDLLLVEEVELEVIELQLKQLILVQ
jgi:hypothetical protein